MVDFFLLMALILCEQNDMKEDEFESHKDATSKQKLEVDCSLLDETNHYWDNIWDQRWGGAIYHLPFVFLTRSLGLGFVQ
jgi:hypothetical protein